MRNLTQMVAVLGSRQLVVAVLVAIVIAAVAFGLSADLASAGGGGGGGGGGATTMGSGYCAKC